MRFVLIYILIFFLGFLSLLHGQTIPEKPKGFVNDYASLLGTEDINRLNEKLFAFYNQNKIPIYIAITPSLENMGVDEYGIELYKKWKVGNEDLVNGMILCIAVKEKKIIIQVSPANYEQLPDTTAMRLIDEYLRAHFRTKNYYKGLNDITNTMMKISVKSFKIIKVVKKDTPITGKEPKKEVVSQNKPVVVPDPYLGINENPSKYLSDFANLLNPEEALKLEEVLLSYHRINKIPCFILTLQSMDTLVFRKKSNAIFKKWLNNVNGMEYGFLLTMVIKEKKIQINYDSLNNLQFNDTLLMRLLSKVLRPPFREKKFYQGLSDFTREMVLISEKNFVPVVIPPVEKIDTVKTTPVVSIDTMQSLPDASNLLKLESFTSTFMQGRILLEWKVYTDSNLIGFSTQRSSDARNFEDIGFVPSNKDSATRFFYTYTDESPYEMSYYKLVQFDFFGNSRYSLPILGKEIKCPKIYFSLKRDKSGDQFIQIKLDDKLKANILEIVDFEGKVKNSILIERSGKPEKQIVNIDKLRMNEVYYMNIPGERISEENKFIKVPIDRRFE